MTGTVSVVAVTWTDDGIGRVLDARYRLVASVGTGASARVYLADDLRLRRQVAVKILHPSLAHDQVFLRRFEKEARAAAGFSHPHVVAVHDWGDTEAGPYLVTEYLAGGSLHALLAGVGTLTVAQSVKIGLEAASGLAAAHRRGLAHRDIKPANLLFDTGGRLRVADFGLVHALSEAALTEPEGVVLGTVRYSAPERSQPGVTDGRTDVYSLVLTMIEAVTGEVPMADGSSADVIINRSKYPIEVPDVFGPAKPILERAGALDIEGRPSADELMRELVHSTEYFEAPDRLLLAGAISNGTPTPQYDQVAPVIDEETELVETEAGAAATAAAIEAGRRPKRSKHPVLWILAVIFILAVGAIATGVQVSSVEPPRVLTEELGDLRGEPIASVRQLTDTNGWILDEDQVRSDIFEIDSVIRQRPGQGSQLAAGASISVDVVVGPLQRLAPWLVGLDVADAVERLEARGFEVSARDPQFDEVAPSGQIMAALVDGSSLAGGRLLEPGTGFDLVVSTGPAPRTVPDLVGLTVADAFARVEALRLGAVEAEREFSETVPIDAVISQATAFGTEVPRGTVITIVVSKGQDRRAVPEVTGLTIDEATSRLEAVGLFRSGVNGGGDIVEGTDPRAGTLLRPGDGVELFAPR